ncbi:hypothetical protein BDV25DRAFT_139610 [Aspergillus avenaceus]|uniref:Uncharacterized protein n=1 Tax=Aspergillus avenaceus TaxID=36643 RepID=A0A5N6TWC4_ASPAV|nr:hypothetical protein BDV25DRAFT_139610 [Aspergillus avenaceus]
MAPSREGRFAGKQHSQGPETAESRRPKGDGHSYPVDSVCSPLRGQRPISTPRKPRGLTPSANGIRRKQMPQRPRGPQPYYLHSLTPRRSRQSPRKSKPKGQDSSRNQRRGTPRTFRDVDVIMVDAPVTVCQVQQLGPPCPANPFACIRSAPPTEQDVEMTDAILPTVQEVQDLLAGLTIASNHPVTNAFLENRDLPEPIDAIMADAPPLFSH